MLQTHQEVVPEGNHVHTGYSVLRDVQARGLVVGLRVS